MTTLPTIPSLQLSHKGNHPSYPPHNNGDSIFSENGAVSKLGASNSSPRSTQSSTVYSSENVSTADEHEDELNEEDDDLFFKGTNLSRSFSVFNSTWRRRHKVCSSCSAVWNAATSRSVNRPRTSRGPISHGPDEGTTSNTRIEYSKHGYSPASLLQWKVLQSKICYNARPFDEMPLVLSTSYAQLVNVFELNWGILEPLAVCASHVKPTHSDNQAGYSHGYSGASLCACSTIATEKESVERCPSSSSSSFPRTYSVRSPNRRKLSTNDNLDLKLSSNATPPGKSLIQEPQSSNSSCIFLSSISDHTFSSSCNTFDTPEDNSGTLSCSTKSTVDVSSPIMRLPLSKKRSSTHCSHPVYCHYILYPLGLDSRRCIMKFSNSVERPCKMSCSQFGTDELASQARQTNNHFSEVCEAEAAAPSLPLFFESRLRLDQDIVPDKRKPRAPSPPSAPKRLTPTGKGAVKARCGGSACSPCAQEQSLYFGAGFHVKSGVDTSADRDNPLGVHCATASASSSPIQNSRRVQQKTAADCGNDVYHAYVLAQLQHLKLHGCRYPKDMFVLFINVPSATELYMRRLACERRPITTSYRQKGKQKTAHRTLNRNMNSNKILQASFASIDTTSSKTTTVGQHSVTSDKDNQEYEGLVFTRAVRWKEAALPLLIRSRSLIPDDIAQSDSNETKVCLFVFLSGKDMVAFDWLPFISRFYNYTVTHGYKNERRNASKVKSSCNMPAAPGRDGSRKKIFAHQYPLSIPFRMGNNEKSAESLPAVATSTQLYSIFDSVSCGLRFASLLVEYPGSGQSCGPPSVDSITDSAVQGVAGAIAEITCRLGPKIIELRFVGYSLGTALALKLARILANDIGGTALSQKRDPDGHSITDSASFRALESPPRLQMGRLILLAPFTSIMDWTSTFLRIPKVLHSITRPLVTPLLSVAGVSWDNLCVMKELCESIALYPNAFKTFKLCIIHGTKDAMIPVVMGRRLAAEASSLLDGPNMIQQRSNLNVNCDTVSHDLLHSADTLFNSSTLPCEEFLYQERQKVLHENAPQIAPTELRSETRRARTMAFHCSSTEEGKVDKFDATSENHTSRKAIPKGTFSDGNVVQMFEVDADHHTVMRNTDAQQLIFRHMFSSWLVAPITI